MKPGIPYIGRLKFDDGEKVVKGVSTVSRVFAWDFKQWAEAAAWFGSAYGWMPLPTLAGAAQVESGWRNRRLDEPGGHQIVFERPGPGIELNREWASRLWWSAIRESWWRPCRA